MHKTQLHHASLKTPHSLGVVQRRSPREGPPSIVTSHQTTGENPSQVVVVAVVVVKSHSAPPPYIYEQKTGDNQKTTTIPRTYVTTPRKLDR